MVTKQRTANVELGGNFVRTLGLAISSLSLVLILLILLVLPGNSYVSSFELLILGSLFIVGLVTALVGKIVLGRDNRARRA